MSIGPATPMGRSYGLPNVLNEGEKGGEEDEKGEWVSGIETPSSNNNGGDKDVRHVYVIPTLTLPPPYHALPTPDKRRRPPSRPLKGEMTGQQSSGSRQPHNHKGHCTTRHQMERAEERQEKARDEARDDEEGQQNRERGQTMEERQTVATNANNEDDAPPPQPPSPPTPPALPPHPERHNNNNHMKSNKTPARTHADVTHNPGSETDSPETPEHTAQGGVK
ncbi:hypothetical protein PAXINDRAFT_16295 [Paxillus involutus ATCC 200175]|uniref:Uncharacterized protein n=1 Tax=Paxillus involutus ATCC 200175 TaxID=664439 RepID=A0A0C9SRW5_PAXIN|nr:hypothetical protein PAXINDRAFT_16295 [Paxillus involutus ATCC 200175]